MKIDEVKVRSDKDYLLAAVRHLAYSLNDVENYDELTNSEKNIISEDMFNDIKMNE
jgi:hypothetical protein